MKADDIFANELIGSVSVGESITGSIGSVGITVDLSDAVIESGISANGILIGDASRNAELEAELSPNGIISDMLIGTINIIHGEYPAYEGLYEVTPRAEAQTIETAKKLLEDDISIKAIPYYDVSNQYGRTIYIGGDINA